MSKDTNSPQGPPMSSPQRTDKPSVSTQLSNASDIPNSPFSVNSASSSGDATGFTEIANKFQRMTADADAILESIRRSEEAEQHEKPSRRKHKAGVSKSMREDSFEDDDDMSDEEDRLAEAAEQIRQLTNNEFQAAVDAAPVVRDTETKETLEATGHCGSFAAAPGKVAAKQANDGEPLTGPKVFPPSPAVEELRDLSNTTVDTVSPRSTRHPKNKTLVWLDSLQTGVDWHLVGTFFVVWGIAIVLLKHARSDNLMDDAGIVQMPWLLRY